MTKKGVFLPSLLRDFDTYAAAKLLLRVGVVYNLSMFAPLKVFKTFRLGSSASVRSLELIFLLLFLEPLWATIELAPLINRLSGCRELWSEFLKKKSKKNTINGVHVFLLIWR